METIRDNPVSEATAATGWNPLKLSVGEKDLSSMYFFFSLTYCVYWIVWTLNIAKIQRSVNEIPITKSDDKPVVFAIHRWISLVLFLQFLSTFAESAEHGDVVVWSIFCYFIDFVNQAVFYSVIILVGSGWSFVKPFLGFKEKAVLVAVVFLQAFYSIALAILEYKKQGADRSKEWYSMYDRDKWDTWAAVISSIDVLCSVLVFIPLVWQMKTFTKRTNHDGEAHNDEFESEMEADMEVESPSVPKLFQWFFHALVAYVYAHFIVYVVYVMNITDASDEYIWALHITDELLTLVFLVIVGLLFPPMSPDSYLRVSVTPDSDRVRRKRRLEHSTRMETRALMEVLSEHKSMIQALAQKNEELADENKRYMEEISKLSRTFNEFAEQYRLDKELQETTSSTVSKKTGMP